MAGKPQDDPDGPATARGGLDPATLAGEALAALGFLTRLPLPVPAAAAARPLARASWAFPLAGLAVGLVAAVVLALAMWLGVPAWAAALLALAASAALTGALHEDGLSDFLDGLAGETVERRLEIMRDSRTGNYGALGLVLATGVKAACLAALAGGAGIWAAVLALVAAHMAARSALPAVMHLLPPATGTGLGAMAGRPDEVRAGIAAGLGVAALLIGLGFWPGLAAAVVAALGAAKLALIARHMLGGINGDALGAVEQAAEMGALLAAAAILV